MSQPDYPIFNKKWQKEQKSRRGGYNFERTKEYHLAEKWFEERKETKKDSRPPSPMIQSPPPTKPVKGPPPGLSKPTIIQSIKPQTPYCLKCTNPQVNPIIVSCCGSSFCLSCAVLQADVYNRCYKCKTVIDISKYEEYDDLDLKIPSYDEFDYVSPDDPVSLTYIPLNNNITQKSSHKLNIFAEEFVPIGAMSSEGLQMNLMGNLELYTNYIYIYNLLASCLQSQVL
jgi:hypothetical protein